MTGIEQTPCPTSPRSIRSTVGRHPFHFQLLRVLDCPLARAMTSQNYGFIPAGATCEAVSPMSSSARRTRPDVLASSMKALA